MVALAASRASADVTWLGTLQHDTTTPAPVDMQPKSGIDGEGRLMGRIKIQSVDLISMLSNFDSDAYPDGWRAEIRLIDQHDNLVAMRSFARFELTPEVRTLGGRVTERTKIDPLRWSKPLVFDEHGVARVKLPVRSSSALGKMWNESVHRGARYRNNRFYYSDASNFSSGLRRNRDWYSAWQDDLLTPLAGILSVRVSVPTQGTFDAATRVLIRVR